MGTDRPGAPSPPGVPCRPTSGPGSWQQGGTAAGPVYSAVGLPGSRGKRGCVQGLINHGRFGRDKQAKPSRDAAAPATDGGKGQKRGEVDGVEGKEGGVMGTLGRPSNPGRADVMLRWV
ncbi:hypothetical protein PAMP_010016 [Pampus punctatissimus]